MSTSSCYDVSLDRYLESFKRLERNGRLDLFTLKRLGVTERIVEFIRLS
jgi:hypothetical protein